MSLKDICCTSPIPIIIPRNVFISLVSVSYHVLRRALDVRFVFDFICAA